MYEEFLSKVSILGENVAHQLLFIIMTDWPVRKGKAAIDLMYPDGWMC